MARKRRTTKIRKRLERKLVKIHKTQKETEAYLEVGSYTGSFQQWRIDAIKNDKDPVLFLEKTTRTVLSLLRSFRGGKEAQSSLHLVLSKEMIKKDFVANSLMTLLTSDEKKKYEEMKQKVLDSLEKHNRDGSGWVVEKIKFLRLKIIRVSN